MAGPIGHLFLALMVLAGPFQGQFDRDSFLAGASFPDIRYLGVIERSQTHAVGVTVEQIKDEKDSFRAGMLFHALVDQQGEEYMQQNKVYDLLPKKSMGIKYVKLIEDLILRRYFKLNQNILSIFDRLYPTEKQFGINDSDLWRWHRFLQVYLKAESGYDELLALTSSVRPVLVPELVNKAVSGYFYQLFLRNIVEQVLSDPKLIAEISKFYLNYQP